MVRPWWPVTDASDKILFCSVCSLDCRFEKHPPLLASEWKKKNQNVAFWSTSPGVLIHAQHFAPETVAGMLRKVEKKVCFLWCTEHSLSPYQPNWMSKTKSRKESMWSRCCVYFHELRSDGRDRLESDTAAASPPLPTANNTTKIQRRGEDEFPCSGASKDPHAAPLLYERERRGRGRGGGGGAGGRGGEARM